MNIFEKYIYIISFLVIVLPFAYCIITKKDFIAKLKFYDWNKIGGVILTVVGVSYLIYSLTYLSYIHLMMGDLCMILGVISGPILLMKKESIIKALIPWMFIGGFFTLLASHPPFREEGIIPGTISYVKHVFLFTFGLIGLCTKRYTRRDGLNVLLFVVLYGIYILSTSGVAYRVTGDEKFGAWSTSLLYPSYKEITFTSGLLTITANDYLILDTIGISYPWPTIIFLLLVLLIIYSVIWIGQKIQKFKEVKNVQSELVEEEK